MFILLGILTSVAGLITTIRMPDNPMSTKWLSAAEKTAAIQRVAVNQTGIQNTHFKWAHLKELVLDVQIWLLVILVTLVRLWPLVSSSSPQLFACVDLSILRGNYNLLRNRHSKFWIFLFPLCTPQYAERCG